MENILGVIFCGGKAVRLGGLSKMDIKLCQRSLLELAAEHLQGHVKDIALSVRIDTKLPPKHNFKIIYDETGNSVAFALLSALKYAKDNGYEAILTLPVDTPFLPDNYASTIKEASKDVDCVYAKHGGQIHGLHSLWKTSIYAALEQQVILDKTYKISRLYDKPLSTSCSFTDVDKSVFLNINTPENLLMAQRIITSENFITAKL